MKYFLLIAFYCITVVQLQAQENHLILVDQPSYIFKFAPRVLSPRFSFEKVLSKQSSLGVDFRAHAYWLPQGIRSELFYRYYTKNAPWGFFVQAKAAFGYFTYNRYDNTTNGLQAGGGFNVGGQFNIGRKNAVIDFFGGFQWIAPIYLNVETTNPHNQFTTRYQYNVIHYFLMAFPLDIGLRFGFVGNKKVPASSSYQESDFY